MNKVPEVLDRITDTVLAHKPKDKVKATKARAKKKAKCDAKNKVGESSACRN